MNTFRSLFLGMLTCLLLACGGYDDDGGLKGAADGSGSSESLETTEFFLAISLPGGQSASALQRAAGDDAVNGLGLENFSAEVLVPDINEEDGFREVGVDVSRFIDLGEGLYSVEIDGTPQVDTVIYVTVDNVRLKVLALRPGSRAEPVRVDLQTTVAVDLFLEQVAEEGNLDELQIEDVESTLEDIVEYLETVEIPANLTEEEALDYLMEEADDACSIDVGGNVGGDVAGGCNLTFSIGGSVTGLQGTLELGLQNDERITLGGDGDFQFASALPDATAYTVSVVTQPEHQVCSLSNAQGTLAASDVSNVVLTCVSDPQYAVRGTASGVQGGAELLLNSSELNGSELLFLDSEGAFAFESTFYDGSPFEITVQTAPSGFSCTLEPGSGVIAGADVEGIALVCLPIPTFQIQGSLANVAGTLTLALESDAGAETLPLTGAGDFAFSTALLDGQVWQVSIAEQPVGQLCSIDQGLVSGVIAAADVTGLVIGCTDIPYTVGGVITGLGDSLTLQLNGANDLLVSASGNFEFAQALTNGDSYSVTLLTQPLAQICAVTEGSGTIAAASVSGIGVSCTDLTYTVGGTVSGVQGDLTLLLNGREIQTVGTDGNFAFATPLLNGDSYQVTVVAPPNGQLCTVGGGNSVIDAANVSDINVTCIEQNLSLSGTVSGLQGSLVLQLQSNTTSDVFESRLINVNGAYLFDHRFAPGDTYRVSVPHQPLDQTCVLTGNLSGTFAATGISGIDIVCAALEFSLNFSVESGELVLPGEEIRLFGQALGAADFTLDNAALDLYRQTDTYVSFDAPLLAAGTHLLAAAGRTGTQASGLIWGERMMAVTAIAPGNEHNCALQQDNTVLCWGSNGFGQLGNGKASVVQAIVPDRVVALSDAVELASGHYFGCARRSTGAVVCWGLNNMNQLGDGSAVVDSATPVTVSGITTAQQIATGVNHACALLQDQSVRCWGSNSAGQLGDGSMTNAAVPVVVSGINNAVRVRAGAFMTCAVLATGSVSCWGINGNGQLGDGSTTASAVPVAVSGLTDVADVAMGNGHTCALQNDGDVFCWGSNGGSQLGNPGLLDPFSPTPVAVTGVSGAQRITAGSNATCVRTSTNQVSCWGEDSNGNLGRGYLPGVADSAPVPVPGISTAVDIAAGNDVVCAVLANNTARCWGHNVAGRLGRGSSDGNAYRDYVYRTPKNTPLTVVGDFDAGFTHVCAVTATQQVQCLGRNGAGQLGNGTATQQETAPVLVTGIADAVSVSAGRNVSCAVLQSGLVQCWGYGGDGQMGNGLYDTALQPVTVSGITNALAVSVGEEHVCAVLQDQRVMCWGGNYSGQLGAGTGIATPADATVPVLVAGITDAVGVAVSSGYSCAVHAAGEVSCWGNNDYGQLGNTSLISSSLPLKVAGVSAVDRISLGETHACVHRTDNTLQCWGGSNDNNLLGDGGIGGVARTPTFVTGLGAGALAVSAGPHHTCAVLTTGEVACWGDDTWGQSGDYPNPFDWPPVKVPDMGAATMVSVGDEYSCARLTDNTLTCWGLNFGQMGPGQAPISPDVRFVPENHTVTVAVAGLQDTVVLDFNGVEKQPVTGVGEYTFMTTLPVGAAYTVSVDSQPAQQTCVVNAGSGMVGNLDITLVVACTNNGFPVNIEVSGLTGVGLTLSLAAAGVDEALSVDLTGSVSFVALLDDASSYFAQVVQQPVGQSCQFAPGQSTFVSGEVQGAAVQLALSCANLPFTVGGTVSGLTGSLQLLFSGVEILSQSSNSPYQFVTALGDGMEFVVGVLAHPAGQYCSVPNGNGFIDGGNIGNVDVQCVPRPYHLSGSVSGLAGTLVLSLATTGTEYVIARQLQISGDSAVAFAQPFAESDTYAVDVQQQPDDQTCTVINGNGTFAQADITNLTVNCVASTDLPQVSRVSPTAVLAGETVVVSGDRLRSAALTVGGQAVTPTVQTQSYLAFVAPALASGPQSVALSNANGTTSGVLDYAQAFTGVASVDGSVEFTCARMQDDSLRCWGVNLSGQLGLGNVNLPNGVATTPQTVLGGLAAQQVSVADSHVCALTLAGVVYCWGNNTYGQLGDGSSINRDQPALVTGITAASVSANGFHSCAVESLLRNVYCWGSNVYGELGDGSNIDRAVPTQISNLSGVAAVTSGSYHSCALLAVPGGVRCWGDNSHGQLGTGDTTGSNNPIAVLNIGNAVALVAGRYHTCALLSTGAVQCWGDHADGQLGNSALTDAFSATPVTVDGTEQAAVSMLVAKGNHACAMADSSAVYCWGANANGALGDGSGLNSATPIPVEGLSNVASLGAGEYHSCAVLTNGAMRCWGAGGNGELGNGAAEPTRNYAYDRPLAHPLSAMGVVTDFSAGQQHACAVMGSQIRCMGLNTRGQLGDGSTLTAHDPVLVAGVNNAQRVGVGFQHSCALLSNATVVCWGANDYGQLGASSQVSLSTTPVTVAGLNNVTQLSVGYRHSCARTSAQEIFCWGDNNTGGLGSGVMGGSRNSPVKVRDINDAVMVDVSGVQGTSCALRQSGLVQCWGNNGNHELASASTVNSAIPLTIPGLTNVSAIGLGGINRLEDNDDMYPSGNVCAISAGGVFCWGSGYAGLLGLSGGQSASATPVKVPISGNAIAVDVGATHACALLDTNEVQCWGEYDFGQVGDATQGFGYKLPTPVSNLVNAEQISLSRHYSCAIRETGELSCWGLNAFAQMGTGLVNVTREVRHVP